MPNNIISYWLKTIRYNALKEAREDILMLSDEELLQMYPLTELDYSLLKDYGFPVEISLEDEEIIYKLNEEINETYKEIEWCEKYLKERHSSSELSEARHDLVDANRKVMALETKMQEMRKKYGR